MSIEKITSKIENDAKAVAQETIDDAKQHAWDIVDDANQKAKAILEQAEKSGIDAREKQVVRRKAVAAIDGRNVMLAKKQEALSLIHDYGLNADLVNDCATHQLMFVPDKSMEDFRRVLEASIEEGGLVDKPLAVGERVRVIQGVLKGVEGNVLELQGRIYVVVGLLNCLYARARVPRAWLERV